MPERHQALMRTRCPECATIFRVTSEQLRQKAGKVRCGHCQGIFNAFDHLLSDSEPAIAAPLQEPLPSEPPAMPEAPVPAPAMVITEVMAPPAVDVPPAPVFMPEETQPVRFERYSEPLPAEPDLEPALAGEAVADEPPAVPATSLLEAPPETLEESTQAAREAGLVAARELYDSTTYNRWAAGALAGNGLGGLADEPVRHPRWPFVLAALLLLLGLLGQLAHHYRGEIVLHVPAAGSLYQALGVAVPLPRNAELIAIEASDLQSDNARGLFVLQATLKNRALYAQAWPVLELTLTDINDAVVSRRAMYAADYLPPGTPAESFAANGELGIRLWVEAKGIGASGYRLYLFYP